MNKDGHQPLQFTKSGPVLSVVSSGRQPTVETRLNGRILSIGLALMALASLLWLYQPTLKWLFFKWGSDEYYAHGPFLPFISAYLIWQQREALTEAWQARTARDWRSPLLLVAGLVMQLAGTIADVQFIQACSIPVVLLGIARFLGGADFARPLRFPLLFLWMAVPLSGMLVQTVTVPMQNNAAACAGIALGLLGVPIERVGVNLYTPHYNFIVAVACSGLKITISLITMEMLIAYMLPRLSNLARCLLVLLTIPISLFTNALRITIIVLIGYYFSPQAAEGFLHNVSGIFMFGLSLALLLWRSSALTKAGLVEAETEVKANVPPAQHRAPLRTQSVRGALAIVAVLLLCTRFVGARAMTTGSAASMAVSPSLISLPTTLGAWRGQPAKVNKVVYEVLNPDAVAQTRYALKAPGTKAGASAVASVAAPTVEALVIYSRQWKNFHSPVMCLRADGWEITSEQTRVAQASGVQGQAAADQSLSLNVLTGERRGGKTYLAYCFLDTDQQVSGWIPTMAKLAGARLLRRSAGVAEVQFAFDSRMLQSNGEFRPELTSLMLRVHSEVQQKLRQAVRPAA